MKKITALSLVVSIILIASVASAGPPIYKEKKYYGPIPYNGLSLGIGFLDGATVERLAEGLDYYTTMKNGSELMEDLGLAPHSRIAYQRQLSPNHFLRLVGNFSYLSTTSLGNYVAELDSLVPLDIERTLKIYLFSVDLGFLYYFVSPEVQRFSPYVGGGFSAVMPMVRLETTSRMQENGAVLDVPGSSPSKNSLQAGLHGEFGMIYFLTNRYAAALEGKYQMAQSKFSIYGGNYDLNYSGAILSFSFFYFL